MNEEIKECIKECKDLIWQQNHAIERIENFKNAHDATEYPEQEKKNNKIGDFNNQKTAKNN